MKTLASPLTLASTVLTFPGLHPVRLAIYQSGQDASYRVLETTALQAEVTHYHGPDYAKARQAYQDRVGALLGSDC